jgi:hypothetical protein
VGLSLGHPPNNVNMKDSNAMNFPTHLSETRYGDWIRSVKHGAGLDAYYTVEVKDMTGSWKVMKRFDEDDEWCMTKMKDFIHCLFYKPQPVRHDPSTV